MSEIELHRQLLGDAVRNRALAAALRQLIVPRKTRVIDIGAGTGYLSFLARRLGAKRCTLIEYSDAIALARRIARANGVDGLAFVQAHSSEVDGALRAELVVSETLGNYALEEGLLETLVDARRFLAPGGVMLPRALSQFVAPVTAAALQQSIDVWGGLDFDFAAAREVALNNMYVKTVAPAMLAGGSKAVRRWDHIELWPGDAPASLRRSTVAWTAAELGAGKAVHGFALWWQAELAPGITLSTSPFEPPTHWQQVYLPLDAALDVQKQETLELTLTSDTRPQTGLRVTWHAAVRHGLRVRQERRHDSFRGRL